MLSWVVTFLVVALLAAFFGFTGVAAGAVDVARVLFGIFLVLFVVSLVWYLATGRSPRPPV
jgi:uncharacterized membrane protein YtjA (UPF0391 family)